MSDLSPTTNPDAQEALSAVQSNRTVLVLPLKSGRFAIFGRDYQLHAIFDQAPSAQELQDLSTEIFLKLFNRRAEYEFLGEPSDKQWKADRLSSHRSSPVPKPRSQAIAIDIGEL